MKRGNRLILAIIAAGFILILNLSSAEGAREKKTEDSKDDMPSLFYPRSAPSKNLPCSKCHRYRSTDNKKRKLELAHSDIVLKHADRKRWCLDCHDGDKLRLPNGELVDYDKPYILCGQCHGTVFRDWKAGLHGKTVGKWNGEKVYYVCVSCHDPHQPKFKQIEPEKQPMRPAEIKLNLR